METLTTVFFYGGIMNPAVMKRLGLAPRRQTPAVLPGYDITFAPLVNLVRRPLAVVYGLLAELPHCELAQAYGLLKVTYDPEAVLTFDESQQIRPALCYIANSMPVGPPDAEQVRNLLAGAVPLGFPDWYLDKVRGFAA